MMDLNQFRVYDTLSIRINSIPFLSELFKKRQKIAVYYEPSYHEGINSYLHIYYDFFHGRLGSNGIEFIYFPIFLEHIDEYIRYFFPDSTGLDTSSLKVADFYKAIAENIVEMPATGRPMLLITDYSGDRCETLDENSVHLIAYDLDYADYCQFNNAMMLSLPPLKPLDNDVYESVFNRVFCCHDDSGYDADEESNDVRFIEIAKRVAELGALGVNKALILQFLSLQEPKLSKLVITDDFRLLLSDYDNREIKMPKLSKALYFLYLRHKEGLLFKELRDHKEELYDLYRTISPRENMEAMEQSIERLVDSTNNNINVNCSRIKNAFLVEIDESLACQYYVEGERGEPKFIILDRSLVEDQSGMIM